MRYVAEASNDLQALLVSAQREPIFIEQGMDQIAVLMSAREYERLRGRARTELRDFCDSIANRANALGLTEAKLNDLLSDAD